MFELHPQLAKDTYLIGDLELCRVLLMDDQQYPWLILVPRRVDIREIFQLALEDQRLLLTESAAVGALMVEIFAADKLNVAALGNMVPQLHLHHIARYQTDPAWPKPVWGVHPAMPYDKALLNERVLLLQARLLAQGLTQPA